MLKAAKKQTKLSAPPDTLAGRALALIEGSGRSPSSVSKAAGLSDSFVRDLVRRPHQSPSLASICKLADELQTTPEWLAYGVGDTEREAAAKIADIPLVGSVAAGLWREVETFREAPRRAPIHIPADPRFPASAQFDLLVAGTSINRVARDGDYLRCVSVQRIPTSLHNGNLVIVERRRIQDGQVETTAKRLKEKSKRYELWPDSNDPAWDGPIVVEKDELAESETIKIIAKVLFSYRPLALD